MSDAEALQAQAARVREQANALHRANQKAFEARSVEHGVQHDRAVRQADAARLEATKATAQADELDQSAKSWDVMATDLDQMAKEDAARGESRAAEENREVAEGFRTNGRADEARANDAREAAREQAARADALDQQVKDMDTTFTEKAQAIDRAADQLDDKARLMEEAVRLERIADEQRAAGKDAEVAATETLVTDAWARAEAIQPDLKSLDPLVLQDAGLAGPQSTDTTGTPRQEPGDDAGGTAMGETTEITAMRTTTDIEAEVAALRQRAGRLHQEATTRLEASEAKSGGDRDEAAAEAWALRQKAKAADIQAQREHKQAMDFNEQARKAEADTVVLEAAGQARDAEEQREQVDAMRGLAKSHTQRAKDAEQRSQDALNQVKPLDQKVKDFDASKNVDPQPAHLEAAADQLQDKARLLEAAEQSRQEALRLREAGDQEKAVEAARRAVDAQAQADAIEPDFSKLDAVSRAAAGIEDPAIEMEPESARPGTPAGGAEPPEIEMEPESARPGTPADGVPATSSVDGDGSDVQIDPVLAAQLQVDSDGDGITDHLELRMGTKLLSADSDDDGLTDAFEDRYRYLGLDPTQADADKDDSNDGEELAQGTDPRNPNTDGDQYLDGRDLLPLDPTNTFGGAATPATTPSDASAGGDGVGDGYASEAADPYLVSAAADLAAEPAVDSYTADAYAPEVPEPATEGSSDELAFESEG